MSKTKTYNCRWCDKPIIGYKQCRDHEYNCALNPKNSHWEVTTEPASVLEMAQEDSQEQAPEIVFAEESPDVATPENESTPSQEQAEEPPEVPGESEAGDALTNLIDARVGFMMLKLEQHLQEEFQKRDQEYGQQFRDAVASLPQVIDQSVKNYLSGQVPAQIPVTGDTVNPIPEQGGNNKGKGITGFLGSQIDLKDLAIEFLKAQGGGNINAGIIKLLTGQGKQKARQVDSKYVTRGMGNMLGVLRMKNADPTAQALAFKSQAEMMLKETLTPQLRDFYVGQKSVCEAFLQGQDLHKVTGSPPGGEG